MSEESFYAQSEKDTWETPLWFINELSEAVGGFDTDPCSGPQTDIGDVNYTIEDNGLDQEWYGNVFVNPPFSQKGDFIQKSIEELQLGNAELVILLTPDSTDVKSWYHGMIAPHADYKWFKRGRMAFIDPETGEEAGSPTFGTMLSIFGDAPLGLLRYLSEKGDLVKTVRVEELEGDKGK